MRAIDIFTLPPGEKVIVDWNCRNQPIDMSVGLLAQFLVHIATNCTNFPIGYDKWQTVPAYYKDHVWDNIIKTKLEVNDDGHKDYILKSLAKKWRDHRCNLYKSLKCDPDAPRKTNIGRIPPEVPLEQWIAFVDYRARPDTKAKAAQNTTNRSHLTIPHMLGSKSFARLENEMESQLGRPVTRAELFQVGHTTSDGSFVNDEARQNHEDLVVRSQSSSKNEAHIGVFGKEHPGYVRGLALGVVPTQVYGSSSSSSSRCYSPRGTQAEVDALRQPVHQLLQ
ncbi:uncharacterized protein LOC120252560 [Dioscorea cayenensis subsp. rotundata]|uniref:Uncharacterized protein LOC120252560 n=1 Tax=Dioscorea cayennensis subsp. rotundata TaxID=55577 RepID=A0AB40ANV4_DIOCR|nr:uncharacterized protein LOC120252560 [Dioscorea cayenensis subsp. rotundata]